MDGEEIVNELATERLEELEAPDERVSGAIAAALDAIQELGAQVDELEARVTRLDNGGYTNAEEEADDAVADDAPEAVADDPSPTVPQDLPGTVPGAEPASGGDVAQETPSGPSEGTQDAGGEAGVEEPSPTPPAQDAEWPASNAEPVNDPGTGVVGTPIEAPADGTVSETPAPIPDALVDQATDPAVGLPGSGFAEGTASTDG